MQFVAYSHQTSTPARADLDLWVWRTLITGAFRRSSTPDIPLVLQSASCFLNRDGNTSHPKCMTSASNPHFPRQRLLLLSMYPLFYCFYRSSSSGRCTEGWLGPKAPMHRPIQHPPKAAATLKNKYRDSDSSSQNDAVLFLYPGTAHAHNQLRFPQRKTSPAPPVSH